MRGTLLPAVRRCNRETRAGVPSRTSRSPLAAVSARRLLGTTFLPWYALAMSVRVYGCNHVAIEVTDLELAKRFYTDVFNLELQDDGEGDAFFKLGEHQFLAMFQVEHVSTDMRHFGLMVRDEAQIAEVRRKVVEEYDLETIPGFRCSFRDPFGNRIDVVDLHDESLVWLLPYQEVQKAGIRFS